MSSKVWVPEGYTPIWWEDADKAYDHLGTYATNKTTDAEFDLLSQGVNILQQNVESPIEQKFLFHLLDCCYANTRRFTSLVVTHTTHDIVRLTQWANTAFKLQAHNPKHRGKPLKAMPESPYSVVLPWHWEVYDRLGTAWMDTIFLTPQPAFGEGCVDGRGLRGDAALWSPRGFRAIIECDSLQFHQGRVENREVFERDRKRSRFIQRRGFQLWPYSGGEITNETVAAADDCWQSAKAADVDLYLEQEEANAALMIAISDGYDQGVATSDAVWREQVLRLTATS